MPEGGTIEPLILSRGSEVGREVRLKLKIRSEREHFKDATDSTYKLETEKEIGG